MGLKPCYWGPSFWIILHYVAAYLDNEAHLKHKVLNLQLISQYPFYKSFGNILPCIHCRKSILYKITIYHKSLYKDIKFSHTEFVEMLHNYVCLKLFSHDLIVSRNFSDIQKEYYLNKWYNHINHDIPYIGLRTSTNSPTPSSKLTNSILKIKNTGYLLRHNYNSAFLLYHLCLFMSYTLYEIKRRNDLSDKILYTDMNIVYQIIVNSLHANTTKIYKTYIQQINPNTTIYDICMYCQMVSICYHLPFTLTYHDILNNIMLADSNIKYETIQIK